MFEPDRTKSLIGIIGGLMMVENKGDLLDEINNLHDLAGIQRPEGNFQDGWYKEDLQRVGLIQKEG